MKLSQWTALYLHSVSALTRVHVNNFGARKGKTVRFAEQVANCASLSLPSPEITCKLNLLVSKHNILSFFLSVPYDDLTSLLHSFFSL